MDLLGDHTSTPRASQSAGLGVGSVTTATIATDTPAGADAQFTLDRGDDHVLSGPYDMHGAARPKKGNTAYVTQADNGEWVILTWRQS